MRRHSGFDIAIVGGGPVGLALSVLLARQGLSVAVVDRQARETLENPAYDGREIALTHASWAVLERCGAVENMHAHEISLIRDAKVIDGESLYSMNFSAREAGEGHLGHMVANNVIRRALYEAAAAMPNISLICNSEISGAETNGNFARLSLENGENLAARLLVAADSRFSAMRGFMGVGDDRLDFRRVCIVCRMTHKKDLRLTAYECFGYDRTLAVLPLRDGACSVVLTLPESKAAVVMAMNVEDFAADLSRDLGRYCGALRLDSPRFAYPLVAVYARKFQANRFTLAGDAAVGMHPVTAHGFNLGLRGADTLSALVADGTARGWDIADRRILERYEVVHRRATLPLYHATNALVRLYTRTGPISRLARQALLRAGNHIPPARRAILRGLTDRRAIS